MDSAVIAEKLESMYPEPSLHLNHSIEGEAEAAMMKVFMPLVPYLAGLGMERLVAPVDIDWFKKDRAQRFGMTVEELDTPKDADAAYVAAKPGLEECKKVLTSHKKDDGPFILGSTPSYADFYFMATMQMFNRAGPDMFDRFIGQSNKTSSEFTRADVKIETSTTLRLGPHSHERHLSHE
jgi:glutathione S-transferase